MNPARPDPSEPPAGELPTSPTPTRGVLTVLLVGVTVAALHFGRDILMPLALALLLSFVLDPLVARLRRWGLPRALGVTLVIAGTVAVLGATSLFVASQMIQLSRDAPTYESTIKSKLRALRQAVSGHGAFDDASHVLGVVEGELDATRRALDANAQHGKPPPMRVQMEPAPRAPMQAITDFARQVLSPLAMASLVMVFVAFILLERNDLRERLLRLVGGDLRHMTDALDEAAERVSRYLGVQLLINLMYGVPVGIGLWLIGVPGALLWGLLAAALRFVPYVGTMIAALFPLTMAFAVDPGWSLLLWTLGLLLTLELLSIYVIEPWLVGASTGLAPVALLVSAAFWAALWGPIGLVLATPLTVCLVVMGRHLRHLRFLDLLFGSDPVFDPPTRLYQRLLAGDVEEAIELAAQQVQDESLERFYSDTALPALRLATGGHSPPGSEHRKRLASGMTALMRDLRDLGDDAAVASAQAAIEAAQTHVLCIGLRTELDSVAAEMLTHAIEQSAAATGIGARSVDAAALGAEKIASLDLARVDVVCLSSFNPAAQVHLRFVCRRLRRLRPDLTIILALWNAPAELRARDAAETLGADAVVTSLTEVVQRLSPPHGPQPQRGADGDQGGRGLLPLASPG